MTLFHETITDKMQEIAGVVFEKLNPGYYLAGGTALALVIGHRKSVDLDYFIFGDIDTARLRQELTQLFVGHKIEFTFEEKNTLWCVIDGVKVSFISRLEALLEKSVSIGAFRLAGVKDITIMKLSAICGREEYKDYFDLACLSKKTDIRSWIMWWGSVYPNVDPTSWLVALGSVDQIPSIPLDILPAYEHLDVSSTISSGLSEITKQLRNF